MSPLFSFVTVRNPRTPTDSEVRTGFLRYDPELGAGLVESFAKAWREGDGAERVRKLATEFRAGPDAIQSDADLSQRFPALAEWARWLAASGEKLTWAALDKRRGEHGIDVARDTRAALWNNLIAYTYGGGPAEVRETLIWALRAVNLLDFEREREREREDEDDDDARRLAAATVLVPAGSHGTLARDAPPDEPPHAPPEDEEAVRQRTRLDRLETLHDAMRSTLDEWTERARTEDQPPPLLPRVGRDGCTEMPDEPEPDTRPQPPQLDESAFKRLADDEREELSRIGIEPGTRLAHALKRVEEEAQRVGAGIWRHTDPSREIVQVGGGLWTRRPDLPVREAPGKERPHRPVPQRDDLQYSDFFGSQGQQTHLEEPECRVKPLGVGDYRRVEQRICCYEPGEVAHIENVLKGETKERTTRRTLTTEQLFTTITEEETTEERDTQTTDRLELERETSKVIETDLSFELGVNIQGSYGPVKIVADTKFATSSSRTESDRQASRYAKEVTDRALERVARKVREERTTRTTEEYEEKNLHRLKATDDHVVGLYRWVEKVYEAKVVNYGKRLMFEFLVPEPAAFHLHASVEEPAEGTLKLEKPVDPRSPETVQKFGRPPLTSHASITETNYGLWAAAYGAVVEPPPSLLETIGKAYHREGMDNVTQFADSKNDLKLPEGREATWFSSVFGLHSEFHSGGWNWITVMIGRRSRFSQFGTTFSANLDGEDDIVPVSLMGRTRFYAINIEIECRRAAWLFARWQHKTFDAILRAYQDRLAAYETALAEAKLQLGVEIRGTNPLRNREIEQIELRKSCIRLLTHCADLPSEAMKDDGECGYPEFECCEAIRDGSIVQFFEQLFEWRLMTYLFYPYFWGRKCNWEKIYQLDDADPVFLQFLQAGFARVVVPVRPGYERAAIRFLADGAIWNGGETPGVDSPMYVAIENELKEPVGTVDPEIEPWEIRVPTSLTVLQCGSGCVEGEGLPCPCEDERDDGDGGDDDGDHDSDDSSDDDR